MFGNSETTFGVTVCGLASLIDKMLKIIQKVILLIEAVITNGNNEHWLCLIYFVAGVLGLLLPHCGSRGSTRGFESAHKLKTLQDTAERGRGG